MIKLNIIFSCIIILFIFLILPLECKAQIKCGDIYPGDGHCKDECVKEDGESEDTTPDICPNPGEKCCHKYAAPANVRLQVPIFKYAVARDITEYITKVFEYSLYVMVPLVIVMIIIAGIKILLAGSNLPKVKSAYKSISYAVIGLIIALLGYAILYIIGIKDIRPLKLEFTQVSKDLDIPDGSDWGGGGGGGGGGSSPPLSADYAAICAAYKKLAGGATDKAVTVPDNKTNMQNCCNLGDSKPAGLNLVQMANNHAHAPGADSSWCNTTVYENFKKALACLSSKGVIDTITASCWRSAKGQCEAKTNAITNGNPQNAAMPCCSNHGSGSAMDLYKNGSIVNDWGYSDGTLAPCFNPQGLKAGLRTSPNEPWHFSPSGG